MALLQSPNSYPDYPFPSHYLDRSGNKLHYIDEGPREAPPVVMLHGNPTWSFYYRRVITALSPRFRCIVPDHIGMGLSDKPGDDRYKYTLDRRANDVQALLEHLNIKENITLILHDWGGMIGTTFATRFPDRIKQFVILNTGAFHLPASKPLPWQLKLCRSFLGAIFVRGFNGFSGDAVKSCVARRPLPDDVKASLLAPYDSWKNRIAVHRFVQDIPLAPGDRAYDTVTSVQDNLHQFADLPMLICWGMKDFVFDHHFLAEWETRFPKATVHRFEDVGHYILEDAHEDVIPLIERFLDSNAALRNEPRP